MVSVWNTAIISMEFDQKYPINTSYKRSYGQRIWFWVAILNLCKLTTFAYLDCSIFWYVIQGGYGNQFQQTKFLLQFCLGETTDWLDYNHIPVSSVNLNVKVYCVTRISSFWFEMILSIVNLQMTRYQDWLIYRWIPSITLFTACRLGFLYVIQ